MNNVPPLAILTAFWLGLQTAISPCPLATNIAAISFISKSLSDTKKVILSGVLYSFGRAVAYLLIAMVVVTSALSVPGLSHFLQKYINMFLGPALIVTGMLLLGLIQLSFSNPISAKFTQRLAEKGSVLSSGLLGFLFALSFCPISAGFFFVGLIPLAFEHDSKVLLPILFGIGTSVPVVAFAFLLVFGVRKVGKVFETVTHFEKWARRTAGALFILVGIYLTLIHIFNIPLS